MIFILLLGFFSFFHTIFSDSSLSEHAQQVLNVIPYQLPAPSIIGKREWQELQLDRLVTILDRSTTSFGRWGLVQLLHPIAEEKELSRRKEIITFLVEHSEEMHIFQEQLKRVKDVEQSLLSYWDRHDPLNQSAHQFYYTVRGLKDLNKSSLALNTSVVMEMFNSWKYLIATLAVGGLATEIQRWVFSEKDDLDIMGGFAAGLQTPYRQHSFASTGAIDPSKESYKYKDYLRAFGYGSLGDRYTVLNKGYVTPEVPFWFFKRLLFTVQARHSKFGMISSFIGAAVPTLFFDYQWGNALVSTGKKIVSTYRTLNELQKRVSDVAQCVDAIQKLQKIVDKQAPTLRSYLGQTDEYDNERDQLIDNLLTKRFLKRSEYVYSRGHVLTMHLDITQKKKTLIPLLHSVALLDAYCSIAQLYKESQNESVVFSFPEFIEAQNPFIQYSDAWLPLLPFTQAITNDLALGTPDHPGKIIITGPNGGGKSTILKALGVVPVLAQSWCIIPAQNGKQVIFSSIRTALAPREDLEHGLSTFMAEKKTMSELLTDISAAGSHDYMLALVDEPYKGTVDAESAKRIYQFGKEVAPYRHLLMALATHVKRPIALAQDTAGIFGNYQVKITETKQGIFERLFKLEPGPAMWWFDDGDKRSRFVDWISINGNE